MTIPSAPERTLSVWSSRDDVRELDTRLAQMLPGADRLTSGQRLALAQASLAHGLDPFNGEIWMIPGRGLMIGVKGLRKKAHEQVKGNYWAEFVELNDPDQRKRLRIPDAALAFECRLFDSENLRTYAETCERLLKAGIPWEAVEKMVGSRPYTLGIGVLKTGEQTKMEPAQCAMKRAEADAIKRRFDVPFGLAVEADSDAPAAGEWVESTATVISEPNRPPETDAEKAEKRAQDRAALFGEDDEQAVQEAMAIDEHAAQEAEQEAPAPKFATIKGLTRAGEWNKACKALALAYPKYQTDIKGKPSGQPNFHHILGAAIKCGYPVVNDSNFELVVEAIAARAKAANSARPVQA